MTQINQPVAEVQHDDSTNRWKQVVSKKNRRSGTIRGKARMEIEDSFRGASRKAWFYVGRAAKDSDSTKLKNYSFSLFPDEVFEVGELQKHASNMNQNKFFKLGCSYSMLEKISDPEIWPENIIVRLYRFFRAARTEGTGKFQ